MNSREPRRTLEETRAEGQLLRDFWRRCLLARLRGGDDEIFGSAESVFTKPLLEKLHGELAPQVLTMPVFLTEHLSNRVLAVCLRRRTNECVVAVNSRFRVDPEVMAHTMVEEFAHAQQIHDGLDVEAQRKQFAYQDRPYEQEAKQFAVRILGYPLEQYENKLARDEPIGILLDQRE